MQKVPKAQLNGFLEALCRGRQVFALEKSDVAGAEEQYHLSRADAWQPDRHSLAPFRPVEPIKCLFFPPREFLGAISSPAQRGQLPQRIAVGVKNCDLSSLKIHDHVFLNPIILATKGSEEADEGCLSFPGLYGKVRRAKWVKVRAYDLEGAEHTMEATGLAARAWQHEIDHLAGVLYIDKMSPISRMAIARNLEDMEAAFAKLQAQGAAT